MRRLLALLACARAFKQTKDDTKPRGKRNVLFMIADDLRPQLGHLGHASDVDTPSIDRLAATGVSFRRAYCQAPACNPSRNSFLTGTYPDVSKVFYFEGVTHLTLGKRGETDVFTHMRSHGYITMGVGKLWHWEPIGEPFTRGTGAHFPRWGSYNQEWGCEDTDGGGRCSPVTGEPYVMGRVFPTKDPAESLFDYRVASDAAKKLELGQRQWVTRRRPFFLGVGFHHPHTKWRIPSELWARYAHKTIRMPDPVRRTAGAPFFAFGDNNIAPEAVTLDGTAHSVPRKPYLGDVLARTAVQELRRGYLASVAFLDVQVGRVLDRVDALSLANDTVVIFTSDHGYGIGERGHWGKGSLYEIDARVPLIVRDPHHKAMWGRSTNALVELVDLYKSVIDLAHLPFSRHMYQWLEGVSWRPLVEDVSERGPRSHALTMVPKCFGKTYGDLPPHNCGGRSFEWHAREGATHALVGFAARSHRYRYVAWMPHNYSLDSVDWARAPQEEELYDNGMLDESDLDSSDAVNLLSKSAKLQGAAWAGARDVGDAHLRWLHQAARDRFFRAFGEYAIRLHDTSPVVREFLPSHARPAAMPPRDPPFAGAEVDKPRRARKRRGPRPLAPPFERGSSRARRRHGDVPLRV